MDIRVENHGSIVLLHPETRRGERWLRNHTDSEAQTLGKATVAEPRYVMDIVRGAQDDGLKVV